MLEWYNDLGVVWQFVLSWICIGALVFIYFVVDYIQDPPIRGEEYKWWWWPIILIMITFIWPYVYYKLRTERKCRKASTQTKPTVDW